MVVVLDVYPFKQKSWFIYLTSIIVFGVYSISDCNFDSIFRRPPLPVSGVYRSHEVRIDIFTIVVFQELQPVLQSALAYTRTFCWLRRRFLG